MRHIAKSIGVSLRHPIFQAGLVVLGIRAAGILWRYLGDGAVAGPLNFIPVTLAFHFGVLLFIILGLLLLQKLLNPPRKFLHPFLALVFATLIFMGQTDFMMLRYTGQHFTPSIFQTYVTLELIGPNIISPITTDTINSLVVFGLLFGGWMMVGTVLFRDREQALAGPVTWPFIVALAVISSLLLWPVVKDRAMQRMFVKPVELIFLEALGAPDNTPAPADENKAMASLRKYFWLPPGWTWATPDYPLMRVPIKQNSQPSVNDPESLPDIVLLMIESLRAPNLGFINGSKTPSLTPNLDRLAKKSVVFPHFISNGFPSAAGFFSINASTWPHRKKVHTAEFSGIHYDSLPQKLHTSGYTSLALWGGNPSFDNQLLWGKRWYDRTVFNDKQNPLLFNQNFSDSETIQQFLKQIAIHDKEKPGKPFFSLIFTAGTHAAYTLSNQFFSSPAAKEEAAPFDNRNIKDVHKRYSNMLRLMDLQIGKLIHALNQRKRKNNTVIIVFGDHSSRTQESDLNEIAAFPMDHYLWTGALIHGPERLVGPVPRREQFPASQVDIMPTILAMIGDRQPVSVMGTDLFADIPSIRRTAIAVRPGGYRLDRGNHTLYVDATNPERFWPTQSFSQWNFLSPPTTDSPFDSEDAKRLHDAVNYWSWLVENDRVWSPR